MKCPVCVEVDLVMTERKGIEIDYCPQCRGIWLDRGELDKIIDRSTGDETARPPATSSGEVHSSGYDRSPDRDHKRKKRKSLLSEVLDELFD